METIFLNLEESRLAKPKTICTQCYFAGGNGQTGSDQRPISLHATTIFKSTIRASLKKKRERERETRDRVEYLLRNNTITRIIAPTQKPEQAVLM